MELLPCHCEAQGGWCEPRNEAIACYTGRPCIVRDCFFTPQAVHRNDIAVSRHSKHSGKRPLRSPFECLRVTPALYAIVFCLFISISVSAQGNDAVKVDTTLKPKTIYQLYEDIKKQPGTSDPIIMLDDSVYNGDIKDIKSEDITSIDVIKGDDAEKLFGQKAKNGAFMIKTKYYEDRPAAVHGPTHIFSDGPVVYVMDGMPIPKELVRTDDVLIKEVVTGKKLEEMGWHPNKKLDSVIVIVTKKSAILEYQMKFSAFSKEYIKYITLYNHNDENFQYEIDGEIVQGNRNMIVEKLYKIPAEKIKKISVQGLVLKGDHNIEPRVTITTKQ